MYLDDGVSRSSAPAGLPQYTTNPQPMAMVLTGEFAIDDEESKSEYREVVVAQASPPPMSPFSKITPEKTTTGTTRIVTIKTALDGYDLVSLKRDIGEQYTVILWHEIGVDCEKCITTVNGAAVISKSNDTNIRATVVTVPIEADDTKKGITITCKY